MAPRNYKFYSPEVVDKVFGFMAQDTKVVPVITIVKTIRQVFRKENISYKITKLATRQLLVHPKNRGGLLVNAFNSHRNGSNIQRCGADTAELHSAVCFEMNPDPIKRKDDIALNGNQTKT